MNNKVWIINHYAGNMYVMGGGRHFYFAKYLRERELTPTVFCSNFDHFTRKNIVNNDSLWIEKKEALTEVPYVFVKTRAYSGNGIQRVLNMVDFYRRILKVAKMYADMNGSPDVIYASSVHPLTLVAGIKIAKYFGIKCISEVRDLWPESIVAYSTKWKRSNPLIKMLYMGEKWIYKKSDLIIMTWPGGYDYIKEQGWSKVIPESKVTHISNGVDIEPFEENSSLYTIEDVDLDSKTINFVYSGSIRKVNNIGVLVDAADILKQRKMSKIKILIYGGGDELDYLKDKAADLGLDNIVFKGKVGKEYIPYILKKSYATILHNSSTELDRFGQSQNKFFEYLAAGRPILMTYSVGHSVIKARKCGIELDEQSPKKIADAIQELSSLSEEQYQVYCNNAKTCSKEYDYKVLTSKLMTEINKYIEKGE